MRINFQDFDVVGFVYYVLFRNTSSAIFDVETTAKSCELKRCSNRTDEANLNFSPELYGLIFFA